VLARRLSQRRRLALQSGALLSAAVAAIAAALAAYYSYGQLKEMQKQSANAARSWIGFGMTPRSALFSAG